MVRIREEAWWALLKIVYAVNEALSREKQLDSG